MMSKLAHTPRSRRAFMALGLPYVLASIFVGFLHVGQPARTGPPEVVAGGVAVMAAPAARPDDRCPACIWLQIGVRLEPPVVSRVPRVASAEIQALKTHRPDSPIQHPTAPRGPPSSSLA